MAKYKVFSKNNKSPTGKFEHDDIKRNLRVLPLRATYSIFTTLDRKYENGTT